MADDYTIGSLGVNITGDWSDLEQSFAAAESAATDAGQAIGEALSAGSTDIDTSALSDSLSAIPDAAAAAGDALSSDLVEGSSAAGDALDDAAGSAEDLGEEAESTAGDVDDLSDSLESAGESGEEAGEGLGEMAEQLLAIGEGLAATEALKEFGEEALNAYGTVQSVTVALTSLTGSASVAGEVIEQIKQVAATEPFAFPEIAPTIQKMVALGVAADAIPEVIEAVGNAAAATGNSFEAVANSFDRMALSGTANARQLVNLGTSTQQLATIMGVTSTEVAAAFKAMDESDRIDVLTQAMQRFGGAAAAQAQTISGAWQIFQNQFEEVMVGVGQAMAPVVSTILAFGSTVLTVVQSAVDTFNLLPTPVKDTAVAIGIAAAALVPLFTAVSAAGFAIIGFSTAMETAKTLLTEIGILSAGTAAAEGLVAAETVAVGAAAAEGAVGLEEVAVAGTGLVGTFGAISAGAAGLLTGFVADIGAAGTAVALFATETIPAAGAALLSFATLDVAAAEAGLTALAGGAIASLTAALPILGVAAIAAGAGFAAWELGSVIGNSTALDDKITNLIAHVPVLTTLLNLMAGTSDQAGLSAAKQAQLTGTLETALASVGVVYDKGTMSAQQFLAALMQDAAQMGLLGTSAITAAEHTNALGSAFDALTKKVTDQNAAVSLASQVLAQAKENLDGSSQSVQIYQAALNAYNAAVATASEKGKDFSDSVAGITQALTLAAEKANSSTTVFNTLLNAFNNGTGSAEAVVQSYAKVQAATKAMGDEFTNAQAAKLKLDQQFSGADQAYQTAITTFNNVAAAYASGAAGIGEYMAAYKAAQSAATAAGTTFVNVGAQVLALSKQADDQVSSVQNAASAWAQLKSINDQTASGQQALTDAMKLLQTVASAVGLTVQSVGGALTFTASSAATASPALNNLAQEMTMAYSNGNQLVEVNGKLVPLLSSVASAATNAAGGVANANGMITKMVTTADGGQVAMVSFANATNAASTALNSHATSAKTAADAVTTLINVHQTDAEISFNLIDAVNTLAQAEGSYTNATSAAKVMTDGYIMSLQQMADTAYDAATAVNTLAAAETAQASKGSGGGGGANMSGASYAEDIASYANSPFTNVLGSQLSSALGGLGYVQGQSGNAFETVSQYNATVDAAAAALGDATMQITDQFGNVIDAINPLVKATNDTTTAETSTSTAASSAATALTSVSTAATTAAAATLTLAGATEGNLDASDALAQANAALGTNFTDVGSALAAVQLAIQQMDANGLQVATAGLQTIEANLFGASGGLTSMIAESTSATGSMTNLSSATSTAATSTAALASSTTTAATAISTAATTVSQATQTAGAMAQAAVLSTSAVVGTLSAFTGATSLAPTLAIPGVTPTNPYTGLASSTNLGTVSPYGSQSVLSPPIGVTVNVSGNTVLNQQAINDLTNQIQQKVVTVLRQAGQKL